MKRYQASLKSIAFGLLAAMVAAVPSRWLLDPLISISVGGTFAGLLLSLLFFLGVLAILLYIPAGIGGFVASAFSSDHRRRNAIVVGYLFILGSIWLDYLRAGHLNFVGILILVPIYSLVLLSAITGAKLYSGIQSRRNA